jgi:hypothetical protein
MQHLATSSAIHLSRHASESWHPAPSIFAEKSLDTGFRRYDEQGLRAQVKRVSVMH